MGFGTVIMPILVLVGVNAVPPDACFANFRWDDCGKSPVPVMYYWKPGSRCEVGMWRGCLPNINMFPDEYECVSTCIFTARAVPEDYHSLNENEIEVQTEQATEVVREAVNVTEATADNITTENDTGSITSAATVVTEAAGTGGSVANADATVANAVVTAANEHAANSTGGGEVAATTGTHA